MGSAFVAAADSGGRLSETSHPANLLESADQRLVPAVIANFRKTAHLGREMQTNH
jgi:hypothetical protein